MACDSRHRQVRISLPHEVRWHYTFLYQRSNTISNALTTLKCNVAMLISQGTEITKGMHVCVDEPVPRCKDSPLAYGMSSNVES